MGHSVLVFISHSSEDKQSLIEPIVEDLENCYINVWLDKRKILPGDNLRKSIFKDGLDKADVALIFFTEKSLKSSWVDREIKHVLREESRKGNDFDLSKIISIFDSEETYTQISERYPELTDDLLHLMPESYDKVQLGQLVSAIWSKYLSLQGGDVETQRQLLTRDKELFQKEKEIENLKSALQSTKSNSGKLIEEDEFKTYIESGKLQQFIQKREYVLKSNSFDPDKVGNSAVAKAFGLLKHNGGYMYITDKGQRFFEWYILQSEAKP